MAGVQRTVEPPDEVATALRDGGGVHLQDIVVWARFPKPCELLDGCICLLETFHQFKYVAHGVTKNGT
jgi:hypothetical protein